MNTDFLIAQGNSYRESRLPELALASYARAFVADHNCAAAFNNYGNVLREMGYPDRALPFLQHASMIEKNYATAEFNIAVCYLLLGDYQRGWQAYESRWNYEHLAGTLPVLARPRLMTSDDDIRDKTVLIVGEQGIGDNIQFIRFALLLKERGANLVYVTIAGMVPLFNGGDFFSKVLAFGDELPNFDFWTPIMSLPGVYNITLQNLNSPLQYIEADKTLCKQWAQRLGPKTKIRVGVSWSGRRDTWINQHKSVPFQNICDLVRDNPEHQWINMQIDCSNEEAQILQNLGVNLYPGTISSMSDTAALMHNLDLVISVDTAVSHLAGAMGRPTWIMLNHYAVDWRWLLDRNSSPWYPSAVLFRQPKLDDWGTVINNITRHLKLFKL